MAMTRNPFLDPAKEIVQGKSEDDILARWGDILRQRAEEAAEGAAMAIPKKKETYYTRLSGTSMAGYYGDRWQDIMKGIEYAAKHAGKDDVVVAHISLGNPAADAVVETVLKYAQSKGVIDMAGSKSDDGNKAKGVSR